MGVINNLPVILAACAALIAGAYGYFNNLPNIRVYQNMCLFLVGFYIIGFFIKRTVSGIRADLEEKIKLKEAEQEASLISDSADAARETEDTPGQIGSGADGDIFDPALTPGEGEAGYDGGDAAPEEADGPYAGADFSGDELARQYDDADGTAVRRPERL